MSLKYSPSTRDLDPEITGDVDFDFFDDDGDKPPAKNERNNNKPPTREELRLNGVGSPTPRQDLGSPKSKHKTSPKKRSPRDFTSKDTHGDDTSIKKVTAKVPTGESQRKDSVNASVDYSDNFDSDSETDSTEERSGRKAPSPRADRKLKRSASKDSDNESKNRQQAWTSESSKNKSDKGEVQKKPRPRTAHHSRRKPNVMRNDDGNKAHHSASGSDDSLTDDDSDTCSTTSGSESDLTDVSPVGSPVRSPLATHKKHSGHKSNKSKHSSHVTFKGNSKPLLSHHERILRGDNDQLDMKLLMQAVMEMEKDPSREYPGSQNVLLLPPSSPQDRKNFSFSNMKVRDIDRENQRLMGQILRYAHEANQLKMKQKKPKTVKPKPVKPTTRMTSSGINRLREQERIDRENRAMLKRLETAKASSGTRRDDLLKQYDNKLLYGISVASAHPVQPKKKRSPYDMSSNASTSGRSRSMSNMRSDLSVASQSTIASSKSSRSTARSRPLSGKPKVRPAWEPGW